MKQQCIQEISPKPYARLGGLLYLVIIVTGISSEFFFRGKLIVAGDPMTTAKNIEVFPMTWRLGIVCEYVCIICTVVLAMIYYYLLTPVHKNLNLLATFFRMIAITVQVVAVLHLGEALFYVDASNSRNIFSKDQLYTMTSLSIKAHSFGYSISLLFLGCCFLVHGFLIYKSGFLPKILGILIQIAGLGYIVNGLTIIISPDTTRITFPIIFLPVFVAETSLSLWLLLKGVDVDRWNIAKLSLSNNVTD